MLSPRGKEKMKFKDSIKGFFKSIVTLGRSHSTRDSTFKEPPLTERRSNSFKNLRKDKSAPTTPLSARGPSKTNYDISPIEKKGRLRSSEVTLKITSLSFTTDEEKLSELRKEASIPIRAWSDTGPKSARGPQRKPSADIYDAPTRSSITNTPNSAFSTEELNEALLAFNDPSLSLHISTANGHSRNNSNSNCSTATSSPVNFSNGKPETPTETGVSPNKSTFVARRRSFIRKKSAAHKSEVSDGILLQTSADNQPTISVDVPSPTNTSQDTCKDFHSEYETNSDNNSSTYDEDEESIMSQAPPQPFNLDEYSKDEYSHYSVSIEASSNHNLSGMKRDEDQQTLDHIYEYTISNKIDELRSLLLLNPEYSECVFKDGSLPLHHASRHNRQQIVEMLLDEPFHCDPNCKDANDSTPLHWASAHAATDAVLSLCRKGATVNIRDKFGKGPLHLAIAKKCYRGANVLLLYGGDINFKRADGSSAFHIACELGDISTIEWLGTKDKVMANSRDKQGETPLLRAATQGKLEVVEYIMKTQLMSWNARDDKQQSLMHRAAFYGYYDLISRIAYINPAACKTMLNEHDRSGDTPLHMAVKRDHFRECKLLCKMGADPMLVNRVGDNALHVAVKFKRVKVARYLYMTSRASADVKNKKNDTPKLMAKRLGGDLWNQIFT
ncbi:secG, partial [Acrasis kona]